MLLVSARSTLHTANRVAIAVPAILTDSVGWQTRLGVSTSLILVLGLNQFPRSPLRWSNCETVIMRDDGLRLKRLG